jgi:acyl-CoA thioester hydrolase
MTARLRGDAASSCGSASAFDREVASAMIRTGAGSVQGWECDHRGHLSLYRYVAHATESLGSLAIALGVGPQQQRAQDFRFVDVDHHVRFLREMRSGTPFVLFGGIAGIADETVRLYQEMRNALTGAVSATFIIEALVVDRATRSPRRLPDQIHRSAPGLKVEVPEHGAPKGIALDAPRSRPTLEEADKLGLYVTQQALLLASECDREGLATTPAYASRVYEASPHLTIHIRDVDQGENPDVSGVAVECRFIHRAPAREGQVLTLRSGIRGVGSKTLTWVHWLFDAESGEAVATAETVGVRFDGTARKAIEFNLETRRSLEKRSVPGISV